MLPTPVIVPKMIELFTFSLGAWKTVLLDGTTSPVKREVITPSMRNDMFADQKGECNYCRTAITQSPASFDVDHIVPVQHGGPTCRANLQELCVSCHRAKSALERRTGASTYASESILVRTEPGFPAVKPADFPGLEVGIYSLDYGGHKVPRPDVKRVNKRITRSTTVSAETHKLSIVPVLDALVRHLGFNGLHDTTTEICLKHVDMKHTEFSKPIRKLRKLIGGSARNKSLSGILGPWLKRYAGVRLVSSGGK